MRRTCPLLHRRRARPLSRTLAQHALFSRNVAHCPGRGSLGDCSGQRGGAGLGAGSIAAGQAHVTTHHGGAGLARRHSPDPADRVRGRRGQGQSTQNSTELAALPHPLRIGPTLTLSPRGRHQSTSIGRLNQANMVWGLQVHRSLPHLETAVPREVGRLAGRRPHRDSQAPDMSNPSPRVSPLLHPPHPKAPPTLPSNSQIVTGQCGGKRHHLGRPIIDHALPCVLFAASLPAQESKARRICEQTTGSK